DLDAGLRQIGLYGLGDVAIGVAVAHVHGHLEAVGQAGLGQQRLRLGEIRVIGVVVDRAQKAFGQEGLVDLVGVLGAVVLNALVIDQPLDGLLHLGLGQVGVLHVQAQVQQRGLRHGHRLGLAALGQRVDVVVAQVAGHV